MHRKAEIQAYRHRHTEKSMQKNTKRDREQVVQTSDRKRDNTQTRDTNIQTYRNRETQKHIYTKVRSDSHTYRRAQIRRKRETETETDNINTQNRHGCSRSVPESQPSSISSL
eukprot:5286867-Pyramimonas_sp.AAC.1